MDWQRPDHRTVLLALTTVLVVVVADFHLSVPAASAALVAAAVVPQIASSAEVMQKMRTSQLCSP